MGAIVATGQGPAGVSGSGFWPPITATVAITNGIYTPTEGWWYLITTQPLFLKIQTAAGVWTELMYVPAGQGPGSPFYSDGTNIQLDNTGTTVANITLIRIRGK